mmetsp:Transcript_36146/g.85736  ORF Transcript_36146/g.85736 Transcript_36146/m.85736 type:complete len:219 (-) Transcript_36146:613-1269(-)
MTRPNAVAEAGDGACLPAEGRVRDRIVFGEDVESVVGVLQLKGGEREHRASRRGLVGCPRWAWCRGGLGSRGGGLWSAARAAALSESSSGLRLWQGGCHRRRPNLFAVSCLDRGGCHPGIGTRSGEGRGVCRACVGGGPAPRCRLASALGLARRPAAHPRCSAASATAPRGAGDRCLGVLGAPAVQGPAAFRKGPFCDFDGRALPRRLAAAVGLLGCL